MQGANHARSCTAASNLGTPCNVLGVFFGKQGSLPIAGVIREGLEEALLERTELAWGWEREGQLERQGQDLSRTIGAGGGKESKIRELFLNK